MAEGTIDAGSLTFAPVSGKVDAVFDWDTGALIASSKEFDQRQDLLFREAYAKWADSGVAVDRAPAGAPVCGKQISKGDVDGPPCGGDCIRAPSHEGPCLAVCDEDNVPGTCPA